MVCCVQVVPLIKNRIWAVPAKIFPILVVTRILAVSCMECLVARPSSFMMTVVKFDPSLNNWPTHSCFVVFSLSTINKLTRGALKTGTRARTCPSNLHPLWGTHLDLEHTAQLQQHKSLSFSYYHLILLLPIHCNSKMLAGTCTRFSTYLVTIHRRATWLLMWCVPTRRHNADPKCHFSTIHFIQAS